MTNQTLPPWSLRHLQDAARHDLTLCRTDSERLLCTAINCREIIETAEQWQKVRKLTPGEQAILEAARLGRI